MGGDVVPIGGPPPVAVTFDFWNTLVCTRSSGTRDARRAALGAELVDLGHDVDAAALDVALDRAVAVFEEHWRANQQFAAVDGALVVVDSLGLSAEPSSRQRLVDAFVDSAAELSPALTPGADEALRALSAADLRLGIICDVGLTPSPVLRRYLDRQGVLELFDHWSFSDEVGTYKPDPGIFAHALGGLGGAVASRSVHVGDLRRTDVAGGRGAGMVTVRYTGRHDDPETGPEADVVLDDLGRLPALLGLG